MFRMRGWRTMTLVATLALAGCDDARQNQNTILGGLLGGGAAGGACLLARGNPLLCAALAVAGAATGGAIGHTLDARDASRRQAALALALRMPPPLPDAQPHAEVADTIAPAPSTQAHRVHASRYYARPVPSTAMAVAGATPSGAAPWVNPDGAVQWVNPDTRDAGTVATKRSFTDSASNQACRDLDESYIRDGKRTTQAERACQQANGTWSFHDIAA